MTRANTTVEDRLAVAADVGEFTEADLEGCDEPAARYFRAAIAWDAVGAGGPVPTPTADKP